ncbi:hypothetical protein CC78DRAFT_581641 [Lojkania enalia]|uniref:Uncharacterized protein n=1 Tax=Lojkania enalia TaxID=147567 RepID=A0A9P4K8S9_9PLEO|nr:hypothetical protein CC78DRAFT_581641 [Didymosphaeria enalia]
MQGWQLRPQLLAPAPMSAMRAFDSCSGRWRSRGLGHTCKLTKRQGGRVAVDLPSSSALRETWPPVPTGACRRRGSSSSPPRSRSFLVDTCSPCLPCRSSNTDFGDALLEYTAAALQTICFGISPLEAGLALHDIFRYSSSNPSLRCHQPTFS